MIKIIFNKKFNCINPEEDLFEVEGIVIYTLNFKKFLHSEFKAEVNPKNLVIHSITFHRPFFKEKEVTKIKKDILMHIKKRRIQFALKSFKNE